MIFSSNPKNRRLLATNCQLSSPSPHGPKTVSPSGTQPLRGSGLRPISGSSTCKRDLEIVPKAKPPSRKD
jgi:hypothetical protein